MAANAATYDRSVGQVTQDDYCRKQVAQGVSPSVCAERYNMYRVSTQGKGGKWEQNWKGK